ncbi:2-vinyl bacteriochlorophyllide hydratase [Rhizobium sp. AAP43]|uniref:2-vinyl bacteriochlorophyllide hydratase n=1 Tax=Rhizobium sp. AAP43 TaxID=1523420 RepID=UPI0006B99AED|nr:2-vinyl bacteriochlorophyllide hydratase [Rhizobium sp. AAP43]KPF43469.1 2-vinyl bacteriochlorophyllide hydratase [Rhizobium sp. AAP43]
MGKSAQTTVSRTALYTSEERRRRDSSVWTLVQGVLAPIQFLIFIVSLFLILRYLMLGQGLAAAQVSVVVKTLALYAIMVTGSIWEKEVFGRYLFARPFFWEDVFSILVLALHTAYLASLFTNALSPLPLMLLALAAYVTYLVNAGQFLWKLRLARLDQGRSSSVAEVTMSGGCLPGSAP